MSQHPEQEFKWTVWVNHSDGKLNKELTKNFFTIEEAQPYVNGLLRKKWDARLRRYKPPKHAVDNIVQNLTPEDEARLDPGYKKRNF